MPITTIIFDFGDVLVNDTSKEYQKKYSKGWSKHQLRAFHTANHMDDMGRLSMKGFCKMLHEQVMPSVSLQATEKIITGFKLFKTNWQLAQELSRSHQAIILSNNSKQGPSFVAKKLGINYRRTPFINSTDVRTAKPHLKIYRYAIKKYRIDPKKAVFIDDKKWNLVPAKKLGMKTILYRHGQDSLKEQLRHLGIKI